MYQAFSSPNFKGLGTRLGSNEKHIGIQDLKSHKLPGPFPYGLGTKLFQHLVSTRRVCEIVTWYCVPFRTWHVTRVITNTMKHYFYHDNNFSNSHMTPSHIMTIYTCTVRDILSHKKHHRLGERKGTWWKCKGQVSASVIHEMHMILSCELLNVHNCVVSWLTGGKGERLG